MPEDLVVRENASKPEKYAELIPQIEALISGESNLVANLANISAALKQTFNFWWVGFYMVDVNKKGELVLGPFQGPVACCRIKYGKGVCGSSWKSEETIVVEDVDKFPGHIACSSLSKSEIVVPIFDAEKKVVGVLDVDSEHYSHFDQTDKKYLEELCALITPLV